MKPVKNSQGHRNMRNYSPRPVSKEIQMRRPELSSIFLQSIYGPQRHIGDYQKSNNLPSWLIFYLFNASTSSPPSVQNKNSLYAGLNEGKNFCYHFYFVVSVFCEAATDNGEHAVYEHSSLGYYQQGAV